MSLLDTIGHPRILVLGDLILDRYTFGNAERVSPEAPVVVLQVDSKEVRLGGAASVAMLLRGLGADVILAGVVGEDPEGRTIRSLLRDEGIDSHLVLVDPDRPTTTKERIIGRAANRHAHQIVRVDHEMRAPLSRHLEEDLLTALARLSVADAASIGVSRSADLTNSIPAPSSKFPTADSSAGHQQTPPTHADAGSIGNDAVCGAGVSPAFPITNSNPPPHPVQPRRPHHNNADTGNTGPVADAASIGSTNSPFSPRSSPLSPSELRTPHSEFRTSFDAVLIADYAKGVCTPTLLRRVIDLARGSHIPVIVDPARITDYSRYAGAALLKPNRTEAELATGLEVHTPEDAFAAAQRLLRQHQLEAVLVTLDRDGMALVADPKVAGTLRIPSADRDCEQSGSDHATHPGANAPGSPDNALTKLHVPTSPREIYDITGAGDKVLAALGLCIAAEFPLSTAVHVANVAAGLEVERFGVAPITRQELGDALALVIPPSGGTSTPHSEFHTPNSPPKLISLPAAVALAAEYRSRGKSLVFTNGCFDLLHIGHVRCLEQAAGLGDVLIVAINSDSSVRRLKGPARPIVPAPDRAALLAALDCVDHVLIFDEPTPHVLLEKLRPDVLAKGGTTPEIIGREVVEAYGGRVLRLSEVPGISTTSLLASSSHAMSRVAGAGPTGSPGGEEQPRPKPAVRQSAPIDVAAPPGIAVPAAEFAKAPEAGTPTSFNPEPTATACRASTCAPSEVPPVNETVPCSFTPHSEFRAPHLSDHQTAVPN